MTAEEPHIRLDGVVKAYGPVRVLKGVSMDVRPGEVHVLAGENGAGKSTLMKVLAGIISVDEGTVEIGGETVRLRSPIEAGERGIAVIHQELSLVPSMSILDNLFLGDMPTRGGLVREAEMRLAAKSALERVGLTVSLDTPVERLPIATQQLVEVAKALRPKASGVPTRVVIMDEPTSALNIQEAERLFRLIDELKAAGVGIVYISHKMDEIERLADRITVLRDGEWVATRPADELSVSELISLMVGDKGSGERSTSSSSGSEVGEVKLEIRDATLIRNGRVFVDAVSLQVEPGRSSDSPGWKARATVSFFSPFSARLVRCAGRFIWTASRSASDHQAMRFGTVSRS